MGGKKLAEFLGVQCPNNLEDEMQGGKHVDRRRAKTSAKQHNNGLK